MRILGPTKNTMSKNMQQKKLFIISGASCKRAFPTLLSLILFQENAAKNTEEKENKNLHEICQCIEY